jgi:tryptophan halogenase
MNCSNGHDHNGNDHVVKSILVLGGGSAGFLAAITLKHRLPHLPVTLLRSPEIAIIGVGESTIPTFPKHLHEYLKLDIGDFFRRAEPLWKLGIRFLWGKRPYFDYVFGRQLDGKYKPLRKSAAYYCDEGPFDYVGITSGLMTHDGVWVRHSNGLPIVSGDFAYQIENNKFVAYLETVAQSLGIIVQDDTVVDVLQNEAGVSGLRLASGTTASADLYIDSSGFASVLLGKALGEPFISFRSSLFNDRTVVGGWRRGNEPIQPYTTAETMNAGWCWRIDHETRINRGYVYSSAYISDADAEAEFRAKNPKISNTRVVKFKTGRYVRGWVKNVVAIGNSAGFVEPLESTSLGAICTQLQAIAESLADCDGCVRHVLVKQYNKLHAGEWDLIRQFLAIHFKFNTRLDTPYWQACRSDTELGTAAEIVEYYQEHGPSGVWRITLIPPNDPFQTEGYLSMLLGQQVPCRKTYTADAQDLLAWQQIRYKIREIAARAFSVPEALRLIRSPAWKWPERFYAHPMLATH